MGEKQAPDWRDLGVSRRQLIAHELSIEARQRRIDSPIANPSRVVTTFELPDGYDISWHDDAACKGIDPNLLMPKRGEQAATEMAKRKACGNCAVWAECLEFALFIMPDASGIWGGTSENERRQMRKEIKEKRRNVA